MAQCAIAINDAEVFKSLHQIGINYVYRGQLTMSILPGSTEVLDRSTMQLVACRQDLCNSRRTTQNGGGAVNVAPARSRPAVLLSMTSTAPLQLREAMYAALAHLAVATNPGDWAGTYAGNCATLVRAAHRAARSSACQATSTALAPPPALTNASEIDILVEPSNGRLMSGQAQGGGVLAEYGEREVYSEC
ncbi:hypothetical protein HaLaN_03753 [Haematococcus lacustris]|uniref:Uncharacterized protein n=1 Tax=Haematococcus lacustris TaxID=44745 RepID=A0A699YP97_HAELA|nr:hypothetical protein HaLaN_03753 [Haematococcus lacustris]